MTPSTDQSERGASAETAKRPRLSPEVADVRRAVREQLQRMLAAGSVRPKDLVLVALSGGADSLALAAACAFEAPKLGLRVGSVTVDHGLQADSAEVAERAAAQARALGLDPVDVRRVTVDRASGDGPEAAARAARYAALADARAHLSASAILLAHTRDDQAETVLLGLVRGSGAQSLAGMPTERDGFVRPLLDITRAQTLAMCRDAGLEPWHDPHNTDPVYTRVRVRERVLPVLEAELGGHVTASLARTAAQLREDAELLERLTAERIAALSAAGEIQIAPAAQLASSQPAAQLTISVSALATEPAALRNRIIRSLALTHFDVSLTREHTLAIAALVTEWHGQGPIHVTGCTVTREQQQLRFAASHQSPSA